MARITDLAADPGHSRDGSGVVDRDVRAAGGVQRRCAIRGNAHEVRSSPNGIERIDADRGCPANGVPAARPADIEPECPEERVAALADADGRHPGSGDVIRGRGRTPRAEVARFVADDDGSVSGEVRGLGLRDRQLIDREPIRREEGRERITGRSVGRIHVCDLVRWDDGRADGELRRPGRGRRGRRDRVPDGDHEVQRGHRRDGSIRVGHERLLPHEGGAFSVSARVARGAHEEIGFDGGRRGRGDVPADLRRRRVARGSVDRREVLQIVRPGVRIARTPRRAVVVRGNAVARG